MDIYMDNIISDDSQPDEVYEQLQPSHPAYEFFDSFRLMNELELEYDPALKDSEFRRFIIEKSGRTVATVKLLAPSVLKILQKPQQLIYDDNEYYIAIDTYTYTYYVCYKRLMMVDIDFYKDDGEEDLSVIEEYCKRHKELKFRIFKTRNGYHAFLVSEPMDYRSDKAIEMMLDLGCDFYYTIFVYWRGWSVRLNRKKNENRDIDMYEELASIGEGNVDDTLDKLVILHINLMKIFQNEDPNLLYGQ
jgi:hypothetical protein